MNGIRFLETASVIAIVLRTLGVIVLLYVFRIQLQQFRTKTKLQSLKKLLAGLLITDIFMVAPILFVNYLRVVDSANPYISGIATMMNAAGVLIGGVLLYLIYTFKQDE